MKPFSQYLYENTDEYRQLDELADELISELSRGTLKNYMGKSRDSHFDLEDKKDDLPDNPSADKQYNRLDKKSGNRYHGIAKANERLKHRGGQDKSHYKLGDTNDHTKRLKRKIGDVYKKPTNENHQIDELSSDTMKSYVDKSIKFLKRQRKDSYGIISPKTRGNREKVRRRFRNHGAAVDRFNIRNADKPGVFGGRVTKLRKMGYAKGDGK